MAFNPDPFQQAREEVASKSMGQQIWNSSILHNFRSAFSSPGSAASKAADVTLGVGQLLLSLIPLPVIGAVISAATSAINSKVRSELHGRHYTENDNRDSAENAKYVKYQIKELTVENLDRYRWKVSESIDMVNKGITAYNAGQQTCDDMYAFCLLTEQVDRRKKKLIDELVVFKNVLDGVNRWIVDLEQNQLIQLEDIKNKIKNKSKKEIQEINMLFSMRAQDAEKIALHTSKHTKCKEWCYMKKTAKYDPHTNWDVIKSNAGSVANFLQPIALSSVAIKQSDYSSDSSNSRFTG